MFLNNHVAELETWEARMLECAAFQASKACKDTYSLYLEEYVTCYRMKGKEDSMMDVLHQALQPLPPLLLPRKPEAAVVDREKEALVIERYTKRERRRKKLERQLKGTTWKKNKRTAKPLVCPMCRAVNKVFTFGKQKRAADEPENQYAQCIVDSCEHVWRIG